jgi:SM-20-related protein
VPPLDIAAFRAAPLVREPFDYLILPGFVSPEALAGLETDYPEVPGAGSFPVKQVAAGPGFWNVIDALRGKEFRDACAEKFGLDLARRPVTVTVRGRCSPKDGRIHTDSKSKLITILVYPNAGWEAPGGRLRLLRSPDNMDDVIAEVPPVAGTLVAFRRSDNSYHGHLPFDGSRHVIQLNWLKSALRARFETFKHNVSGWTKRLRAGKADEGYKEVA